jgi:hypothetical protein
VRIKIGAAAVRLSPGVRDTLTGAGGPAARPSARRAAAVAAGSTTRPEIKPVERIWLHFRGCSPSLRLLHGTSAIIGACCDAYVPRLEHAAGSGSYTAKSIVLICRMNLCEHERLAILSFRNTANR